MKTPPGSSRKSIAGGVGAAVLWIGLGLALWRAAAIPDGEALFDPDRWLGARQPGAWILATGVLFLVVLLLRRAGGKLASTGSYPIPRTTRTLLVVNSELFRPPRFDFKVSPWDGEGDLHPSVMATLDSESSPERFSATLAATALLPDASGEATLTKTSSGWRIVLDASGLPRLEDGRFYQAWLRDAAGGLVPVGTFNEGEGVTLWGGVSPKDFTTLTVTREQADGDQTSSGEKVLVGTVDAGG